MIKEYEFGQPRIFLDKEFTADKVRALNIARCGRCGRRVQPAQHGEWCDVCLATTNPVDEIRKALDKVEHEPAAILCTRKDAEMLQEKYGGEFVVLK